MPDGHRHTPSTDQDQPRNVHWLTDPTIFAAEQVDPQQLDMRLRSWVTLTDSMTATLGQHFGQMPDVTVYHSGPCALLPWEREILNPATSVDTEGYARHISLSVGNRPVLAARSVVALGCSIQPLLSELQTTPLASLLFEDPNWQRCADPLPLSCGSHSGRACVWMDGRSKEPLIVEEFFLF